MNDLDSALEAQPESLADLPGEDYKIVLKRLTKELAPKTYLEIGTLHGDTIKSVECASIAIDPGFKIAADVIGKKPICAFYQMTSDRYFECHDPKLVLGGPIEFAFLDGLHRCEFLLRDFINVERHCKKNSVVVLHDCVPVETAITDRIYRAAAVVSYRRIWWLGDVWRTLLALKRRREDLKITVLNAPPSGLVCITNLDPRSAVLADEYASVVDDMLSWDLQAIGVANFHQMIDVQPTSSFDTNEKITRRFWL